MSARHAIAIDIGRQRLRALLAQRDGGILRVKKVVVEDLPDDLAVDDPEAVGAWVGGALRQAGFPRARTTVALAREHVGLKRITLPTDDPHELPEMTRLAMQRELPFDAAEAVIDFVPVARTEHPAISTTVLAVAVQRSTLDHAMRLVRAARLRVERISLRAMGSAVLLRHLGEQNNGATESSILAVDITGEMVEFCVVDPSGSGSVRFSRAAEMVRSQLVDELADAVITETRRTWMSYRIGEEASDVRHVVLMGARNVCDEVVRPIGEMLRVEGEVLRSHPLVDSGGQSMDRVWPLAGLLLEERHADLSQRGGIDFAHPRKAPNRAVERRKKALFAAGLAGVVLLGLWTFGTRELAGLRADAAALEEKLKTLQPRYERFIRDEYKRTHIEMWESAKVDWLEHMNYLAALAPGRQPAPGASHGVVLDSWTGALDFRGVTYDRRRNEFGAARNVQISVGGEARDRSTADAFREALVRTDVYAASSTGADAASAGGGRRLAHPFSYRLRTSSDAPQQDEADEQEQADAAARAEAGS